MRVPNVIHFVFGLREDFGGRPFSLTHYLAIKSAQELNQPNTIFFHCCYEPNTSWFEKCRPYLHINKVTPPKEIMGNKLYHFAHQADVIRLEALLEQGGIYLDIDTISVKSLYPLREHAFAIGKQYDPAKLPLRRRLKRTVLKWNLSYMNKAVRGLGNAVMLAEPNSFFVKKWYESYASFRSKGDDEFWDEHSALIPLQLASEYPKNVEILDAEFFHFPLYDKAGLRMLFEDDRTFPNAYVHHLWESQSWDKYLSQLTVENIKSENTTYNRIARHFL